MDAEMIILCDGVVIPQSKKEIDGGVAIAGGHILRIGARAELSDYLGVDTEVVEYHNSTLFTFDRTNTEGDANIAVVAGNMKHHGHGDLKKTVGLRFLIDVYKRQVQGIIGTDAQDFRDHSGRWQGTEGSDAGCWFHH